MGIDAICMSSANKIVLKSYVKGLVPPQEIAFLQIEISFQKIFCFYVQTMKIELKFGINLNQLKFLLKG